MAMNETSTHPPLDDAPSWIDASLIGDAMRRLENDDTIAVKSLTITRATAPGDNYGSILYRVVASLADGAGQRSLVVKAVPKGDALVNAVTESGIFSTEIAMLTEYIPAMKMALDRGAPDRFPFFAALCPLHDKATKQFLILEDLKTQGFRLAQRHRGLGLRHTLLALRSLARFHAASAVVLNENSTIVHALPNFYRGNGRKSFESFFTSSIQMAADALRKWRGFQEYADTLDRLKPKVMDVLAELNDPVPEGFNVIAHGDFWINNMMFKYDENGSPIGVRFLDFQVSHVTSPVVDVLNLLYTSVHDEVLEKHEQLLLREYHVTLTETLDLLGIRGPSFKEFTKDINDHGACSVFCVLVYWPMTRSVKEVDVESSLTGESGSSITSLYETDRTKRWLQYILPIYKNRGWLEF